MKNISMERYPVTLCLDNYQLCLITLAGLHVADHRYPIINEPITSALFGLDFVIFEMHIHILRKKKAAEK
jgi:hypothetical protein